MNHDRRRIIPIVVILGALGLLGYWYFEVRPTQANGGALTASGTIVITQVQVGAELGGRVLAVNADEGDPVSAGDVLVQLDDTLYQAQRAQAAAALQAAEANLASAEDGLASAQAAEAAAQATLDSARAAAQAERLPVEKALDDLNINAPAARGEAARAVAAANRAVRDAEYTLFNYNVSSLQKDLTPSEALSLTQRLLEQARAAFDPYRYESENNDTREARKDDLDEAQAEYDSAVRRVELEAALQAAQSRLHKAESDLAKLQDGPNPQDVASLEARLAAIDAAPRQAEAALDAAKVGIQAAGSRLEAARAAVAQAQSAIDILDVQIQKLTIVSPADGVVLTRTIEPGEIALPSSTLLVLGLVDDKTITVYVPEDRYGEIKVGGEAVVSVDSFPGVSFKAVVESISDQAEFTPRNVQTVEGRKNTVFAIRLKIVEADERLKPGMPADVLFK